MASAALQLPRLLLGRGPECNTSVIATAANFHRAGSARFEKTFLSGAGKRGAEFGEPVSIGLGLHAPLMAAKAREPIRRGIANFWCLDKPEQKLGLTGKTAGRLAASRRPYNVPQQPETVPLWLWICLASYRTVKDSLQFLWEQPGQLKDIEWPSFQSTIRMAVLTVVVVAFLIIFLATIDSTFSYILSSILRRVP